MIGYGPIKDELLQICDMIKNRELYEKMGARLPRGLLIYGDPGLGKSLMARCFIEESGLKAYKVQRDGNSDGIVSRIIDTFDKACENAPSIVFLDDMDKYPENSISDKEYAAVQSGIDEVRDKDVFVIATANGIGDLPETLIRSGRFDRKIEVETPSDHDAEEIILYYLSGKNISEKVDMDDLRRMIKYRSCADLEMIINDAAMSAAYRRKKDIEMDDLIRAVIRTHYNHDEGELDVSEDTVKRAALHEAGHLVVSEILMSGSVGLASLRSKGGSDGRGFVQLCNEFGKKGHYILTALAVRAAVGLYYPEESSEGCASDLYKAIKLIKEEINVNGSLGFNLMNISQMGRSASENWLSRNEAVIHAELERYMMMTSSILMENRNFLEKTAEALMDKQALVYSDIKRLKG